MYIVDRIEIDSKENSLHHDALTKPLRSELRRNRERSPARIPCTTDISE